METGDSNKDASKPFITSITLGGFQVFNESTTIPLGQLTFLFGPNSAGKSAVEDGLVMLCEALSSSAEGGWNLLALTPHWRRVNGTSEGYAPVLTMGLTATIQTNLAGALEAAFDTVRDRLTKEDQWGHDVSATFRYKLSEDYLDGWSISSERNYVLGVDGQDILCLDEGKAMGVNFAHPLLRGFRLANDFAALADELPDCFSHDKGWIWLYSIHVCLKRLGTNRGSILVGLGIKQAESMLKPSNWQERTRKVRPAVDELVDFFDNINDIAVGNTSIEPRLVAASRTTPSGRNLTHLCTPLSWGESAIAKFDLLPDSDSTYHDLAESCLHERIGGEKQPPSVGRDLLDNVNRALSDHLFLDHGYRVAADVRLVLDIDEFSNLSRPALADARNYPALVQLHLIDAQDRRYSFDEVGSGLGYVLPVLCSVGDSRAEICLLQQPELHLHPALQSALGDVFIEAAGPENQIIIETHSEHLLLRILKRIRQTSGVNPPVPELRLKADDVVVAYFDPKPDGTTSVKHLRISEDGEFLDRWPRGFFTERDGELFDE